MPHEQMYILYGDFLNACTHVYIKHYSTHTLKEWIKFMNILPCMLCVNVMFFSGKMVVFEYEIMYYNTQARCIYVIHKN